MTTKITLAGEDHDKESVTSVVEEVMEEFHNVQDVKTISRGDSPNTVRSGVSRVDIDVTDGGIVVDTSGVDKEVRRRLESRFERVDNQTGSLYGGGSNGKETGVSISKSETDPSVVKAAPQDIEIGPDGSITFTPPFTKKEAGYKRHFWKEFDESHERCESCAHFIDGGGLRPGEVEGRDADPEDAKPSACHIVQGKIQAADYCEEFYADVGVFGHEHDDMTEVNLILWGEEFDFDDNDIEDFIERIKNEMRGRSGI